MIYGFIGTGTITAAMIEGMMTSALNVTKVLVSPRNAEIAAGLDARFSKVEVAASNQAVVDEAEILVLAVRPQVAEEVLRALRFPSRRKLISVIAATDHSIGLDRGRDVVKPKSCAPFRCRSSLIAAV